MQRKPTKRIEYIGAVPGISPRDPAALRAEFAACVSCTSDCARIVRRPEKGVPPRGFALGPGTLEDKVLIVAFAEPAPIAIRADGRDDGLRQLERQRYQRAFRDGGAAGLAAEQEAVTLEAFNLGRSPLHKRTMGLLRDIFGTSVRAGKRTYFTNLTKCEKEESPGSKDWQIPETTRTTCVELHLRRELEIVQPSAVLAFGIAGDYAAQIGTGRTIVADNPGRPGGPRWLYGSERERTIAAVRALIGKAAIE